MAALADEIAGNIRGLRAKYRMTQKSVASSIGVSEATIANYENGVTVPDLETAWKLADLFDVTVDALGRNSAHK